MHALQSPPHARRHPRADTSIHTCGSTPPEASTAFASGCPTSAGKLLTSFDRVAGVQLLLLAAPGSPAAVAVATWSSPNSSSDQDSRASSASVAVPRNRCRCTSVSVASSSWVQGYQQHEGRQGTVTCARSDAQNNTHAQYSSGLICTPNSSFQA